MNKTILKLAHQKCITLLEEGITSTIRDYTCIEIKYHARDAYHERSEEGFEYALAHANDLMDYIAEVAVEFCAEQGIEHSYSFISKYGDSINTFGLQHIEKTALTIASMHLMRVKWLTFLASKLITKMGEQS